MPNKVQVVEIGMPRTASRSLAQAMKALGYTVSHGTGFMKKRSIEEADRMKVTCIRDLLFGLVTPFPYDNYEFVGNLPALHWKQLAEENPDLKFILTIRDIEDWYKGCHKRWKNIRREQTNRITRRESIIQREIISLIMQVTWFGCYALNPFRWKDGFKRHNDEVIKYFEGTDRLLIHNVFEGDGWKELCEFLDKDIPDVEYPRSKSLRLTTKPNLL